MPDPKTVLPGALTAADLLPYERLALKMARQQLERGENPPPNTTGVIVEALERITAAAPRIAAAERKRIVAWLRRAADGRREYAERTPASHEITPWLELAASCLESAAQLITDPQTMLDVIPSWRWTEDEIAALYGKDGSDAPPA